MGNIRNCGRGGILAEIIFHKLIMIEFFKKKKKKLLDIFSTRWLISVISERVVFRLMRSVYPECFRPPLTFSCLLDCLPQELLGQTRLYDAIKHYHQPAERLALASE